VTRGQFKTPRLSSDARVFGRALAIYSFGVLGVAVIVAFSPATAQPRARLRAFEAPPPVKVAPPAARLEAEPLTPKLRHKGFHECYPHDPLGLGPYAPYRNLRIGRITIPRKGGHTADVGYDVIVHFHGKSAVRKTLVQVARGVAFVGIDKGVGSGRYSEPFKKPKVFPALRRSIVGALREHTGDQRAHIRHLALSAWSAGYGAINEILKHGSEGIDAVVLLDALHAGWNRTHPRRDGTIRSASTANIAPTVEFARRALAREKIFIFTHSHVDPLDYPSTALTADLLLAELGQQRKPVARSGDRFYQTGAVDVGGLHVWSYRGTDELAHCAHISLIARAVRDVLEQAWDTPRMDRNVPPTPAPKLGPAEPDGEETGDSPPEPGIDDHLSAEQPDAEEAVADGAGQPRRQAMDTAGLEPVPLGASDAPGEE
jgi:hypothetical protein